MRLPESGGVYNFRQFSLQATTSLIISKLGQLSLPSDISSKLSIELFTTAGLGRVSVPAVIGAAAGSTRAWI